jgi:predicted PurR-regulated permease PerM
MTPAEPPGEPPSGGIPRTTTDPSITSPVTGPTRARTGTWFGVESPGRKFLSRWGLPVFVVLILYAGREVLLPFVFASLIAYILAPVVQRMTMRRNGTKRMPRGVAIIMCYLVFIAAVAGFLFLLVPRLSSDVARLGKEAPVLLKKMNEEWTPQIARWLEERFPSLTEKKPVPDEAPAPTSDAPLPPGTALTVTPLPDGRLAVQLNGNGFDLQANPDGSYHLRGNEVPPEAATTEDKLRSYVRKGFVGLQSKLNDVVRLGQSLIAGFIRGIFLFFFTLMIGAFILIDLDKVHAFLRSLFPANVRDDYDIIIADIDRGLSGVIRGQLLICVINGFLTYIGLLIFGVKYSLILAMVAGMMSLVPIFGSILSSVPIVLVALVSGDSGIDIFRGVAMTLWIVGIHFIEANLLNPKIIGTAAKIHPVLVIFSLFLGEHSYGLVGALLAVPILSAIQVVFMYFYRKTWKDPARRAESGPIKPPLAPTRS